MQEAKYTFWADKSLCERTELARGLLFRRAFRGEGRQALLELIEKEAVILLFTFALSPPATAAIRNRSF